LAKVEELLALAAHPKFVAIGETGLDYHYTAESAEIQKQSLRIHIEAAQKSNLPLIIHARAADDDMADILGSEYRNAPFNCVMHCFSSSPELGRAALDLGFYLSMSGIATFPKSQEVRDIFASAPLDRILVETDAPYLAPPPFRGKRNEPAYTAFTAQVGADVFGLSLSEFAAQTEANFERLFWKAT
jgi:TatD DNase family protein